MHRVGIDLGGTKIEAAVLDPEGRVMVRRRVPTLATEGYASIVQRIAALYHAVVAEAGQPQHTLGIGTPGARSRRTGLMKNCNTVCLNGRPLDRDLAVALGHPLRMENDANCFALAEALQGAGRGNRMVFGVILGTGCGGGLVLDGQVWTGRHAIGGEWGHMQLRPDGPPCYCGQRGCNEAYLSGGGLEKRWQEAHGDGRSLAMILQDARHGEPEEAAFFTRFLADFGRALANVIDVLDPDIVVLGGGVSNVEELYGEGVKQVARQVFTDDFDTPIVPHALGDSAGVIGAALIGI